MDGESFRDALRALLADRHGPEAKALFLTLSRYVEGRVRWFGRSRGADLFGDADLEEIVGDVMYQLMSGSLAQFRGGSLPELLGFVRTVTDRCLWKQAHKRIEEKRALETEYVAEVLRGRQFTPRRADELVLLLPESPIDPKDQAYLEALLAAGSKAAYARDAGVSRAAVTKRVDRIKSRIEAMEAPQKEAAEAWLEHAARRAVGAV